MSPAARRAADVFAVLTAELPAEGVFAPQFLAAIPPDALREAIDAQIARHGAFLEVVSVTPTSPSQAELVLRMERALAKAVLTFDPQAPHQVLGLQFTSFDPVGQTADSITAALASLPGKVAVRYGPLDGEPDFAFGEQDAPFAIGSTFKLYVLSALSHEIAQGRRSWSDVHRLQSRSLPSGMMQDWPADAPVTLHTLATMMITISDNTATDTLIDILGRETIEAEIARSGSASVARNTPFLKTLEAFALKSVEHGAVFAQGDPARRREVLRSLATRDLAAMATPRATPQAIDTIEWFASPSDTAGMLRLLTTDAAREARAIMAISTALPEGAFDGYSYVGYKGGSETGVLNLTWLLRERGGEWRMLTLHWNDPEAALDEAALVDLAQRILALD